MATRKSLTKSLHTVSAVVNVALFLAAKSAGKPDPTVMVHSALTLLGQAGPWDAADEVVQQCIRVLTKKMGAL